MSPGQSNDRKAAVAKKPRAKTRPAKNTSPAKRNPFPPAKRATFLELIRAGKNRPEAAAAVGLTGSKIRRLVREGSVGYDPDFAASYAEAIDDGDEAIAQRLADEGLRRQFNADTMSDRGLHNERIFRDPDYRAAHRQGPSVSVTTEMEVTHVHIEGAAAELREQLAQVVDLDTARVAARARPTLTA